MKLTIFTPTFNRAAFLPRVYHSILSQEFDTNDIEWLIVDDGSTDDTKEIVESLQNQSSFRINYIYQENRGKGMAINTSLLHAGGDYYLTLDSDDYLVDGAKDLILQAIESVQDRPEIIAVNHVRDFGYSKERLEKFYRATAGMANILEHRYLLPAEEIETTHIHKTNLIRKYRIPVFDGEFSVDWFMHLNYALEYKVLFERGFVAGGAYQEGGLTQGAKRCAPRTKFAYHIAEYEFCKSHRGTNYLRRRVEIGIKLGVLNLQMRRKIWARVPSKVTVLLSSPIIVAIYLWELKKTTKLTNESLVSRVVD